MSTGGNADYNALGNGEVTKYKIYAKELSQQKNDTYHEKEYKRQVETNINIKIRSLIALFIISFSLITCGISENGEADSHSILHRGYYQNRQLKEMGAIIDSIKQGYWVTYDSLGNIKSESVYIDGEKWTF